ncbi:alkaline phosphatase family protein [Acholeplasma granularum]|uniref:alkaline phosphatase family protein n=1 Tax=Acholeplasma granularum TaxID=264635 RepID=UPI0004B361FF|nr:alkaline phosphatase family protein [Acholeplasma granularum]
MNNSEKHTGTFNRKYPSYYKPDVPLIKDAHVVYINWDGFARYYLDELIKITQNKELPTLKKLMKEGIFFNNLRNTFPSITNPVQNQILTGSTSLITKNVYRYYDKETNRVIQQHRENNNPTIINQALEKNLSVVSIRHFLTEKDLTYTNPTKLYVEAETDSNAVKNRGDLKSGDFFSRFESFDNLLRGRPLKTKEGKVTVKRMPSLTAIYMDDLDGLGHNFVDNYGYKKGETEEDRMNNVMSSLVEMDEKLGDIIEVAKEKGIYDKLTFFLTTDHGMSPYGLKDPNEKAPYGQSKISNLKEAIKKINNNYNLEMVLANQSPKEDTTVVAVGANLNLQLTFKDGIEDEMLQEIKKVLLKESYIGKIYTRQELIDNAYDIKNTDMIITPKDRYFFNADPNVIYTARGQHDSTLDTSNHIVGWIWGKGIKKNIVFNELAFNYDIGQTMAAALGLVIPNANGIVLDVFDIKEENSNGLTSKFI